MDLIHMYTNAPVNEDQQFLPSVKFQLIHSQQKKFYSVKMKKLHQNQKEQIMIQFIDISDGVLFNEQKAKTELISLINACITHSLFNPLNVIMYENVFQQYLCVEIMKILRSPTLTFFELKNKVKQFVKNLKEGCIK